VLRNAEVGIEATQAGAAVELSDVLVQRVAAGRRGYGVGLLVTGRATATASRLAVFQSAGSALAAVALDDPMNHTREVGAALHGSDICVRDVASSTVRLVPGTPEPAGRVAAYGVSVDDGGAVDLRRVLFDRGGHGFYFAGGALDLRQVVIAAQLDAAGAYAGAAGTLGLRIEQLWLHDNAVNDWLRDDALPSVAALPRPTPVE
jgi:hypothetical protein